MRQPSFASFSDWKYRLWRPEAVVIQHRDLASKTQLQTDRRVKHNRIFIDHVYCLVKAIINQKFEFYIKIWKFWKYILLYYSKCRDYFDLEKSSWNTFWSPIFVYFQRKAFWTLIEWLIVDFSISRTKVLMPIQQKSSQINWKTPKRPT